MARSTIFFALVLLVLGTINVGCPSSIPDTHPTQAILDMEQNALDRVNSERAAAGLGALVMDENIRSVARAHSEDMVARGFFAHVNPDGRDPFQRLAAAGIGYVSAGENIAWNSFADPAEEAVRGWMASPPHRANILRAQFDRTGMGVSADGDGGYYFTQVFIGTEAKSGEGPVIDYSEPLAAAGWAP